MSPKKRSHGDGGLWKRGDGLWVGSVDIYSHDGKRQQKRVYSKTRAECMRKLDELKEKIKGGLVIVTGHDTLGEWLDRWLEDRRPHVRQKTWKFYEETVRLHIKPTIGKVRLDRLTPQHLAHAIEQANSPRNAQRIHQVTNMALNRAVDMGVLARNPVAAIEKPQHAKKEQDVLSVAEAGALYAVAAANQPMMASRWAAALWTGARPAELRGLEWDRVDFDSAEFDLSWQLQELTRVHGCGEKRPDGTWPCGKKRSNACPHQTWDLPAKFEYRPCEGALWWTRPKTEKGKRIVPIVPPLLDLLREHRERTADQPNPHGLVWHWPDGRPIAPKQEWKLWVELLDMADVPRIDQYSTRHTTGTLLDELGVPEDVRMQIMGHSSKVAHRSYIHVDRTRTRAALAKLAEHMPLLPAT